MFKIGEFATLTQIAVSQLRYYDEIDLFTPARVDPDSGYRYYTADQIPQLDQIIVLRDLGFSLDQIRELQQHHLNDEELWEILSQRREELIQSVRDEIARLRQLEARLEQFAQAGNLQTHRVVVKPVPEQQYLYARGDTEADHADQFRRVYRGQHGIKTRKQLIAVHHDNRTDYPYEIGFVVTGRAKKTQELATGVYLQLRTLPAVEKMACLVYAGRWDDSHAATVAIGYWLEQHDYHIAGALRKVFLQISDPAMNTRAVVEVQIPVTGGS